MVSKFKADVRGVTKEFKHYGRHMPNARNVSMARWITGLKKIDIEVTKEMKDVYKTAFNMGYNHGRKRYLNLNKSSQIAEEATR